MKNLLILLAIPMLFISCVRDNDEDNNTGETVNLDLDLSLSFTLEKTGEANKGAGITNKFSEFNHIFKDEVDLVFTSTTTDFTTTLTITPNDLSNTPTLVIPYGTYSWSIAYESFSFPNWYKDFLPIYGSGSVQIYSPNVSLDLEVDTSFGLVTVEKNNVESAKLSVTYADGTTTESALILKDNYLYKYVLSSDYENTLLVNESVYGTSISTIAGESNQTDYSLIYPKTHYNYILAFSDVDVNSVTLKTAAFEQFDYYLQPTATVSPTCVISGSIRDISQFNEVSFTMTASNTLPADIVFDFTTTCSETLNVVANNLPEGLTVTDYNSTFKSANLTGVVSATASGTYNYTITAFNSDNLNTATASGTVTGTIIVTGLNPIYLDENGVTIKSYEWANVGSKGIINGVEYTIVDETTLREMVTNDEDVTKVVTTKVANMNSLFESKEDFNQNVGSWDTSNVVNMRRVFRNSYSFNQDISNWDTSSVTNMSGMFGSRTNTKRTPFNKDISNWNVNSVTNMSGMFTYSDFNKDIGNWNVSNVTDMSFMFNGSSFNQEIGSWDVSNVTNMTAMFQGVTYANYCGCGDIIEFNQDISNWDVSSVNNMQSMFNNSSFNQDIGSWDVSNVTNMSGMFSSSPFDKDVSSWNVSNVTNMRFMFTNTTFNKDIGNWNVSNVTNMSRMFQNSSFNQSIANWNVGKVISSENDEEGMNNMFKDATAFNQDLSSWCVTNLTTAPTEFDTGATAWTLPKPVWGTCPE
jgi:surface protein